MIIQKNNFQFKYPYFVILITTISAIVSFPVLIMNPSFGLDHSWKMGLHLAQLYEFVWGKDISFTYGPLGYLYFPLIIDLSLWFHAIIFKIIFHLLFFITITLFLLKYPKNYFLIFGLGVISIILAKVSVVYVPVFTLLLAFFLYLTSKRHWIFLLPITFTSSFAIFLKFDVALMSTWLIISSTAYLIYKKDFKKAFVCLFSFVGFVFILWTVISGSLGGFDNYISNQFIIALDYSEGASTVLPSTDLVYLVIPALLLIFLFILKSKNNADSLLVIFLSSFLLFAFYKLGFVREGHMHIFFITWSFLFLVFFRTGKFKQKFLKYSVIILVAALIILFSLHLTALKEQLNFESTFDDWSMGIIKSWNSILTPELESVTTIPNYFTNSEMYLQRVDVVKESIKDQYPLLNYEMISLLENRTVNVYPYDIAYVYSNDLNWLPSPTLQNYIAFNSVLDNLDSDFYGGNESPDYILFHLKTIDGRYKSFAEPKTLQTIFCNYHIIDKVEGFEILKKNSESRCQSEENLDSLKATLNIPIKAPFQEGIIFAKIHVERTLLGDLAKLFYKTPPVTVSINGQENQYRFTYPSAKNGLILSDTSKISDFPTISKKEITEFEIHADKNYYKNKFDIEFVAMKIIQK